MIPPNGSRYAYDVFLAVSSAGDLAAANALAHALERAGTTVWFPQRQQRIGDDAFDLLNKGIQSCRKVLVLLSPEYLADGVAMYNLRAWIHQEMTRATLLPVRHHLTQHELEQALPLLGGIRTGSTDQGLEALASELLRSIEPMPPVPPTAPPLQVALGDLVKHIAVSKPKVPQVAVNAISLSVLLVLWGITSNEEFTGQVLVALSAGLLAANVARQLLWRWASWASVAMFLLVAGIVFARNGNQPAGNAIDAGQRAVDSIELQQPIDAEASIQASPAYQVPWHPVWRATDMVHLGPKRLPGRAVPQELPVGGRSLMAMQQQ